MKKKEIRKYNGMVILDGEIIVAEIPSFSEEDEFIMNKQLSNWLTRHKFFNEMRTGHVYLDAIGYLIVCGCRVQTWQMKKNHIYPTISILYKGTIDQLIDTLNGHETRLINHFKSLGIDYSPIRKGF